MATYFIGDIQGCFDEFKLLLDKISFSPDTDTLYLAGDLIGRGPKSLETLDYIIQYQDAIHTVLGNHDLHFLAIANGIKSAKPSDRFEALLAHANLTSYVDYLRQQPLLIELTEHKIVLTHAGMSPQWDLAQARQATDLVATQLKSKNYTVLLTQMYQDNIDAWQEASTLLSTMIFAINACTRMRYCNRDGTLDFSQKCPPSAQLDDRFIPWYQLPNHLPENYRCVFGHWASLMGMTEDSRYLALDTGCLWGGQLTAWCLEENTTVSIPAIKL